MLAKVEFAINFAKDSWLRGVELVEAHPHAALAAIVISVVRTAVAWVF